jgi:tetratricopeptide (TPR) repeat protein
MAMDERDIPLERLAGGPRKGRGEECPSAEEWASLAAGLMDPGRREALLAHSSQCDSCGALLHAVVEDFSEGLNDEEQQALEGLPSSKPEWRRKMSAQMAAACSRWRLIPIRAAPWQAKVAALIAAAGAAGLLGWNHWVTNDPARLIARAYTQQRPFEFRVNGAEYGPVRLEKSAVGSQFKVPSALIDAEDMIARRLEDDPDSARWLQLRGRAELLAWNPEAAIVTLDRAQARKRGDPDLLADAGVAYALTAEARNRSADYVRAAQFLVRSLQAKPDNATAVFNLALVYQRMTSYADAERQWRRYLELDTAGAWRSEAQNHLAEVQQKMNSGRQP